MCGHIKDKRRPGESVEVSAGEKNSSIAQEQQVRVLAPVVGARDRRCPARQRRVYLDLMWEIAGASSRENAAVTQRYGYGIPAARRHVAKPDPILGGGIECICRP